MEDFAGRINIVVFILFTFLVLSMSPYGIGDIFEDVLRLIFITPLYLFLAAIIRWALTGKVKIFTFKL